MEAGVIIIEADSEERGVGYEGRPNRYDEVTLDACIMDYRSNMGSGACLLQVSHPASLARAVVENTPDEMLAGRVSLEFAMNISF